MSLNTQSTEDDSLYIERKENVPVTSQAGPALSIYIKIQGFIQCFEDTERGKIANDGIL